MIDHDKNLLKIIGDYARVHHLPFHQFASFRELGFIQRLTAHSFVFIEMELGDYDGLALAKALLPAMGKGRLKNIFITSSLAHGERELVDALGHDSGLRFIHKGAYGDGIIAQINLLRA